MFLHLGFKFRLNKFISLTNNYRERYPLHTVRFQTKITGSGICFRGSHRSLEVLMLFRAHLNLISRHFGLGWSDQRFFLRLARSDQRSLPDGTSTCKFLLNFCKLFSKNSVTMTRWSINTCLWKLLMEHLNEVHFELQKQTKNQNDALKSLFVD